MPYFLESGDWSSDNWRTLGTEAEQLFWHGDGLQKPFGDTRSPFGPFARRKDAQEVANVSKYIPELAGLTVRVTFRPDSWERAALEEIPRSGILLTNLEATPVCVMEELAERDVRTALLHGMGIGDRKYKFHDRPHILFEKATGASSGEGALMRMAAEIYEPLWRNDYNFVGDVLKRFSMDIKARVRPVLNNLV